MKSHVRSTLALLAATAAVGTLLFLSLNNETKSSSSTINNDATPPIRSRSLLAPRFIDPKTINPRSDVIIQQKVLHQQSDVPWNGIQNSQWCRSPELDEVNTPTVDYTVCTNPQLIRMDIIGGLTSYLNKILRVALWAASQNSCFYIDEEEGERMNAKLGYRIPEENFVHDFLDRYFEHMGLKKGQYERLVHRGNVEVHTVEVKEINEHEFGPGHGLTHNLPEVRYRTRSIPQLGYNDMDSISMKKHILRRIFRIKPKARDTACSKLASHSGLDNEYMALSVRRGDKVTEFDLVATVDPYIEKAEAAISTHFDGIAPTFFVATDDCTVMSEFREARPQWNFVSECDNASESNGFVFHDMEYWNMEQTDAHFLKFISEMIAMASAKYWIGVSTTNVSYWIYFMRELRAHDDTYVFVDKDPNFLPW